MLSHLPFMVLSREKVGMYALYMATLGNYPDLFAGKPHASQLKEPMEYEVPEAYKQADSKFAKLIEAGERYIGYPYGATCSQLKRLGTCPMIGGEKKDR